MKPDRRLLWGTILAVAAGIVIFAPPPEDGGAVVGAVGRPVAPTVAAPRGAGSREPMLAVRERDAEDAPEAVFRAPPPPPPPPKPAPVAEAPPQAPPLPFRYLGRQVDGEAVSVFVQHGERNLVLTQGTVVAEQYRVERIDDAAVTFRYLPLDQIQTLPLGAVRR